MGDCGLKRIIQFKRRKKTERLITYMIGNLQYSSESAIKEGLGYISDLYDYSDVSVFSVTEGKVIYSNVEQQDIVDRISSIVRREVEIGNNLNLYARQVPQHKVRSGIKSSLLIGVDGSDDAEYIICIDSHVASSIDIKLVENDVCLFILLVSIISLYNSKKKIEYAFDIEPITKLKMREAFVRALSDELVKKTDVKSVAMLNIFNRDLFRHNEMTERQQEQFLIQAAGFIRNCFGNSVYIVGEQRFGIVFESDVHSTYAELEKFMHDVKRVNEDVVVSCVLTPLCEDKTAYEHVYILESNLYFCKSDNTYIVRNPKEISDLDKMSLNNTIDEPDKMVGNTISASFNEKEANLSSGGQEEVVIGKEEGGSCEDT